MTMNIQATPSPEPDRMQSSPQQAPKWWLASSVSRYKAGDSGRSGPGCLGRIPTGGDEHPAGAGLYQDCRHAGSHGVLHAVASAAGICRVRFLALPGGRCRFGNRIDPCREACDYGSHRKREICGAGIDGRSAHCRISAAGPSPQARLPGRFLIANRTDRVSHRSWISGGHRRAGRDGRTRSALQSDGWTAP